MKRAAWLLLALVPAGSLLVLLLRPVWDVDIFWQLKLGELILQRGGPISTEPFAALHQGEPLPAVAWAGQAVMALTRLLGGWGALRVLDALCWLGGGWAVAAACRWRGSPLLAIMPAILLSFLLVEPTASVRPQSFACLGFGLLLALLRLDLKPGRMIALGAALFVVWQNLHPSVSVGAAAAGFAALPGWAAWMRDRSRPVPVSSTALALIGAAATFATPDGFSILEISARNAEASLAIHASEWLPLWAPDNRVKAIWIAIFACPAAWITWRHRERADPAEVAVAIGLLLMTVVAYRFVLFWSVALVPVIARAFAAPDAAAVRGRGVALVALPVLLVAVATPLLSPTRFAERLPIRAAHWLRQVEIGGARVSGTIYGDFPFGGVLIDTGYPDWRVAYDGRYYRYERKEWQYNGGIENGIVPLIDVVRKWNPAAFVLDETHNAPLAQQLAQSRGWQRIYRGEGVVVYVPRYVIRPRSITRPVSPEAAPR